MYLCSKDTKIVFCHYPKTSVHSIVTGASNFIVLYCLDIFHAAFT